MGVQVVGAEGIGQEDALFVEELLADVHVEDVVEGGTGARPGFELRQVEPLPRIRFETREQRTGPVDDGEDEGEGEPGPKTAEQLQLEAELRSEFLKIMQVCN